MKRTYLPPPLFWGLGVNKEDYPLRKKVEGGTAYRGAGSTTDRLAHNSTNFKGKYNKNRVCRRKT